MVPAETPDEQCSLLSFAMGRSSTDASIADVPATDFNDLARLMGA
jgi:hypothetical protein